MQYPKKNTLLGLHYPLLRLLLLASPLAAGRNDASGFLDSNNTPLCRSYIT